MLIDYESIDKVSKLVYPAFADKDKRNALRNHLVADCKRMYNTARVREFTTGRKQYYFLKSEMGQNLNMVLAKY